MDNMDLDLDFYEDDEPVEKIKAAFAAGRKGQTEAPCAGATAYLAIPGIGLKPASENAGNGELLRI